MSAVALIQAGEARPVRQPPPSIRVAGASVRFGELSVFEQLSFEIAEGEFVSLLGPSGCGKSTLLKAIAGLVKLCDGTVQIGGHPLAGPAARGMAIAFQKPLLLPWRNLLQNVLLPVEIELGGSAVRPADVARARRMIDLVRLSGFEQVYPHQLSGGMQQRAAIARALMSDPEVLLMDEPFGALDELTRTAMNGELLRIWRSSETRLKTIVMVTHSVPEAAMLSDRVLVFGPRPARIVESVTIAHAHPRELEEPAMALTVRRLRSAIRIAL